MNRVRLAGTQVLAIILLSVNMHAQGRTVVYTSHIH